MVIAKTASRNVAYKATKLGESIFERQSEMLMPEEAWLSREDPQLFQCACDGGACPKSTKSHICTTTTTTSQARALCLPGHSRPSLYHIYHRTPLHTIIHVLKHSLHTQTHYHILLCTYPYKYSPLSMNAQSCNKTMNI